MSATPRRRPWPPAILAWPLLIGAVVLGLNWTDRVSGPPTNEGWAFLACIAFGLGVRPTLVVLILRPWSTSPPVDKAAARVTLYGLILFLPDVLVYCRGESGACIGTILVTPFLFATIDGIRAHAWSNLLAALAFLVLGVSIIEKNAMAVRGGSFGLFTLSVP